MITRYDKRKTLVEKSAALVIHYGDSKNRAPEMGKPETEPEQGPDSVSHLSLELTHQ